MPRLLAAGLIALLLSACQRGPEQESVPYRQAARWMMPMTVRVVKTWDLVRVRVEGVRPEVTHLVEVEVLVPPAPKPGQPVVQAGDTLVLPFDSYARQSYPPERGDQMTITAAEFVLPDPRSHKRWQR